jgi:hypothetical protein
MNPTQTALRAAVAVLVAFFACAWGSPLAQAQDASSLQATCTSDEGSLFRIDNFGDREYDFTLRAVGAAAQSISGSAYPIGRGGAYAFLPAGATAVLEVRGEQVSTKAANPDPCPAATPDTGRPICEGLHLDPDTREALFVGAADFRGVTSIDITVNNGRVLVYDPHATFVIAAGGAPAPVFEVEDGTATFDAGALFNAGYGLLLQGNASGAVAFFATVRSPGGTAECDPQFNVASEGEGTLPEAVTLAQNYPNPFRPSTEIAFTLAESASVTLQVYDVLGRRVATLVDGELPTGTHTVTWDGGDDAGRRVASGTYLYRLETGSQSLSRTMTLLK